MKKSGFVLPRDPLARYYELYAALNSSRRWYQGALPFRYAALTLATTEGEADQVADEVHHIAGVLKKRAGWFGSLNSEIRFLVAAMLLRNWDDADDFIGETKRVGAFFRMNLLPQGHIHEIMAILLMRQYRQGQMIPGNDVVRFATLYEKMKSHHWWLTNAADYAACAILTYQKPDPDKIMNRIEGFYTGLRKRSCSRGDALQRVSHILFLNRAPDLKIMDRFVRLRDGFRSARVRIWASDWDELAMLTFLAHPVPKIVRETVRMRDAMLSLSPAAGRSIAFNLGASIAFLKLARLSGDTETLLDAKALSDVQAVIAAQQAAAVAAATAAASVSAH